MRGASLDDAAGEVEAALAGFLPEKQWHRHESLPHYGSSGAGERPEGGRIHRDVAPAEDRQLDLLERALNQGDRASQRRVLLGKKEHAEREPPAIAEARHERNRLAVTLILCWLLADDWFKQIKPETGKVLQLLDAEAAQFAARVTARKFVTDPDRREELARVALDARYRLVEVPMGDASALASAGLPAANEIVLLWPDAIGHGWWPIERRVFAARGPATHVSVLNGRGRRFSATRTSLWAFRLRRAVERLWLGEVALTAALFLAAPLLVAWDAIRGHR